MPYRTNTDLPPPVRGHLPSHAQDIYREAFNHAFAAQMPKIKNNCHQAELKEEAKPGPNIAQE